MVQSRDKEVAIREAEVKSKMKVDAVTIEKSKAETKKSIVEAKKSIAEANLIKVQTAQASDDRIFNLLMKRKQLQEVGIEMWIIDENLPLPNTLDEDE